MVFDGAAQLHGDGHEAGGDQAFPRSLHDPHAMATAAFPQVEGRLRDVVGAAVPRGLEPEVVGASVSGLVVGMHFRVVALP